MVDDSWLSGDVITNARANRKTIFVDTGANINALTIATTNVEVAVCTSTGNGFIVDHIYLKNAALTTWVDFGTISDSITVYPYSTTIGDYTTPTAATASSTEFATPTTIGGTFGNTNDFGKVVGGKITGLPVGSLIRTVGVDIQTSAGNIRVKVYQDDGSGGGAGTLLGESGSVVVAAASFQDVTLTSDAVVPASGNVWIAYEIDNNSCRINYLNSGTSDTIVHTYGAGPSPFGTIVTESNVVYHMRINQGLAVSAANVFDGDTTTEWKSNSETHPWVYVDMASAQILTAMAIYFDGAGTTATQVLIQTSPDSTTWTTVRTINTDLLTNGAWNYFRWNLPNTALPRYVRVYGNDGTAKLLFIWEIKIQIPSASIMAALHGHKSISTSIATTALNT